MLTVFIVKSFSLLVDYINNKYLQYYVINVLKKLKFLTIKHF